MYVIKVEIENPAAKSFAFDAQKTMYGGKRIAKGDEIFIIASENEGGAGLIAHGVVTAAQATPRKRGVERQTPRVSIAVKRTASATRRLGRAELKKFADWKDGRPETELNFKFYRQATNKIVGISESTAKFLRGFFRISGAPVMAASKAKLKDGDACDVTAGTHAGKSGKVTDIKTSKTGAVTITVVQKDGERFKTLAKNVTVRKG